MQFLLNRFSDMDALSKTKDDSVAAARTTAFILLGNPLFLIMGLWVAAYIHFAPTTYAEYAVIFASGLFLLPLFICIDGLAIRTLIRANNLGSGFAALLPRLMLPLATAIVIGTIYLSAIYAPDIRNEHRAQWTTETASERAEINAEYDRIIDASAHRIKAIEQDQSLQNQIITSYLPIDRDTDAKLLADLQSERADTLQAIHELKNELVDLEAQHKCEGEGLKCFNGSGEKGFDGPLSQGLVIAQGNVTQKIDNLAEKEALLAKRITELESQPLTAIHVPSDITGRADDLRAQILAEQSTIADLEDNRDSYISERLSYSPPGPAATVTVLWQILSADWPNLAFGIAIKLVLFSIDLAAITSALSLRDTEYASSLRRDSTVRACHDERVQIQEETSLIEDQIAFLKARQKLEIAKINLHLYTRSAWKKANDNIS